MSVTGYSRPFKTGYDGVTQPICFDCALQDAIPIDGPLFHGCFTLEVQAPYRFQLTAESGSGQPFLLSGKADCICFLRVCRFVELKADFLHGSLCAKIGAAKQRNRSGFSWFCHGAIVSKGL